MSDLKTQQYQYKEYKLTLATQDNDIRHKVKNAVKHLHNAKKKYKARLVIRLRGRHQHNAFLIPGKFSRFVELSDGKLEQEGEIQHKKGSDTWLAYLRKSKNLGEA